MRKKLLVAAMLASGGSLLFAQESGGPVKLGPKVGGPVTDMLSANNTGFLNPSVPGNYAAQNPRYEFGVSAEFRLPYHLRFEVDGLFKRNGFDSTTPIAGGAIYQPTTFNNWEIPGLFKFNVLQGRHFRPFVDVGAVYRQISTITDTVSGVGPTPILADNSPALHNRNSYGGVAGFGITFKKGPFELTPEARYTRWANESFQANGLRTNLDLGDVLLGISF
jgi:hypothetical protein